MEGDSPSTSRTKRQKLDKNGRFAALQRLKDIKAGKSKKFQEEEIDNVYDEVEEKEYLKTVYERQNSDWIVDDGGSGYVEDGREIFDDDLDDESIQKASKTNYAGPRKRKRIDKPTKSTSIANMFQAASAKKKSEENTKADDNLLATMLAELENEKSSPKPKSIPKVNKFKVQPAPTQPSDVFSVGKKQETPDEFAIFDVPSSRPKPKVFEQVTKEPKEIESSQTIEECETQPDNSTVATSKTISESQIIEDCSQFDDDFAEDFRMDSEPIATKKLIEVSKPTAANESIIENDDFDDIIGAVDEETLLAGTQNRPEFEDVNFDDVITNLNKEVAWTDFQQAETIHTDSQIISDKDLSSCIQQNTNGDTKLRFYWWDAVENPYKHPGVVNLFGKIYLESSKSFVSCCLSVKNVPRRIYLLPREKIRENGEERETTMEDVYKEFNKFAEKNRILEFNSKKVTKFYAFNREGTPLESEYLEVRYPAQYPAIDADYSGPAIEHVFGVTVNALELFLMERDVKGPSWLEIKSPIPVASNVSWCRFQVNCQKMEHVSVYKEEEHKLPIPSLSVAMINVRTTLNSKNNNTEIAMIGMLVNKNYQIDKPSPKTLFQQHYCFVTRPRDTPWPLYARDNLQKSQTNVIICETETDLLENFLNTIQTIDPDLLVGYDCDFQFNTIYRRLLALRVRDWSRVGKLKHNISALSSKVSLSWIISGRPICDLLVSVKELNVKVRSYDLDSICQAVLKTKENTIKEFKPADCPQFYSSAAKINTLVKVTMSDALYILTLMYELNVIPLALQITCIAGNILSRTLSAGRAERNEYLLLHAFTTKGYITPDKLSQKKADAKGGKKKAAYAGGMVLEPKRGFYDKLILLMDFNSLYPSIIQEYNLCFTTIPGVCYRSAEELVLPDKNLEVGVVPTEIRRLVESRREVKNLMKRPNLSPELKMQYNIRQLALKLTANSMYGCLGATHCRFYAKGLAALVTAKGREILMHTKALVEGLNYEVIYGDTDSLMINSNTLNYDQAFEIAKSIKLEVNKRYKRLELDIDGVFRYLLLLQKKKYAALIMNKIDNRTEYVTEYKGLDIVRRDWCQLACDVGRTILDQIFIDATEEEKLTKIMEKLQDVAKRVRTNRMPLAAFVITKQLSKNPSDYPDKKAPHVAVAMRLNKAGGRLWKAGDTISYIICLDGTDRTPQERAYHVDEFKKREELKIDCNYYLLNQIFPVLYRICEPLESITDVFLAENLDVKDIYKVKRAITTNNSSVDRPFVQEKQEEDPYEHCESFKFNCCACKTEIEVRSFFVELKDVKKPSLACCSNPECNYSPWKNSANLLNALQTAFRDLTKKYYQQVMRCNNNKCRHSQRGPVAFNKQGLPKCSKCGSGYLKKTCTDLQCWNQMSFYRQIFDISQQSDANASQINPPEMLSVYDTLKELAEKYLKRNRFSQVDFGALKQLIAKKKAQRSNKGNKIDRDVAVQEPKRRNTEGMIDSRTLAEWRRTIANRGVVKVPGWSVGWTLG